MQRVYPKIPNAVVNAFCPALFNPISGARVGIAIQRALLCDRELCNYLSSSVRCGVRIRGFLPDFEYCGVVGYAFVYAICCFVTLRVVVIFAYKIPNFNAV